MDKETRDYLYKGLTLLSIILIGAILWLVILYPFFGILNTQSPLVNALIVLLLSFLGAVLIGIPLVYMDNWWDKRKEEPEHITRYYMNCGYRVVEKDVDGKTQIVMGTDLSSGWEDRIVTMTFEEACEAIDKEVEYNMY